MSEDSQIVVPPSFVALFVPPGRIKPGAPREHIAARHELCEDLAQALTEPAATRQWELGLSEDLVLERMGQGLNAEASGLTAAEARWVLRRLAELLGWPDPGEGSLPPAS